MKRENGEGGLDWPSSVAKRISGEDAMVGLILAEGCDLYLCRIAESQYWRKTRWWILSQLVVFCIANNDPWSRDDKLEGVPHRDNFRVPNPFVDNWGASCNPALSPQTPAKPATAYLQYSPIFSLQRNNHPPPPHKPAAPW